LVPLESAKVYHYLNYIQQKKQKSSPFSKNFIFKAKKDVDFIIIDPE